jgi:hypothetical protein
MEVTLRSDLKNLGAAIKVHQAALAGLTAKKNQNTQQYRASVMNAFQQNIQAHQIQFLVKRKDSNGNLVETVLDDPTVLTKKVTDGMPAPVDLMIQLNKSYSEAGKAADDAMAQKQPAAKLMPPLPPPLPSTEHVVDWRGVNVEFKGWVELAGPNPRDILAAMAAGGNKKSMKNLCFCDAKTKADRCALIEEAGGVAENVIKCTEDLSKAHEAYRQTSQLYDALLIRKDQVNAEEERSNPTPRNTRS